MKKSLLFAIAMLFTQSLMYAQPDTSMAPINPQDTAWKMGGNFGLQFTQSSYQYWQAGGVNSIAGNGLVNLFANYDNGGDWPGTTGWIWVTVLTFRILCSPKQMTV